MPKTRFEKLVELVSTCEGAATATHEMVELQCLDAVATYVNYFRPKMLESRDIHLYPSILVLLEAPTGSGKNAPRQYCYKHIFKEPFAYLENHLRGLEDEYIKSEAEAIKALYPVEDLDKELEDYEALKKDNNRKRKAALKELHDSRRAVGINQTPNGTFEGFAADRAYLSKFPYGSISIGVEEFGDKLQEIKANHFSSTMYNSLYELVNNDFLARKSIKGSKMTGGGTPESSGMATTLYFSLASPTKEQWKKMEEIVLKSIGRRGFLLRETVKTLSINLEDIEEADTSEFCSSLLVFTQQLLERVEAKCLRQRNSNERLLDLETEKESGFIIDFSEEAWEKFKEFKYNYKIRVKELWGGKHVSDEIRVLNALIQDLDRKVKKVACLLAIFNHGVTDLRVLDRDIEQAIEMVDKYHRNSLKFFDKSDLRPVNDFIAWMQGRPDMTASAFEIKDSEIFRELRGMKIQKQVAEFIFNSGLHEEIKAMGYYLEAREHNNRHLYTLCKMTRSQKRYVTGDIADVIKNLLKDEEEDLQEVVENHKQRHGIE